MATTRPNEDTPPEGARAPAPARAADLSTNLVAKDLQRRIIDIDRVLDGSDSNTNRMPLTPQDKVNLELQRKILQDQLTELAARLARPDAVASDQYGRTLAEIDGETSRLRR